MTAENRIRRESEDVASSARAKALIGGTTGGSPVSYRARRAPESPVRRLTTNRGGLGFDSSWGPTNGVSDGWTQRQRCGGSLAQQIGTPRSPQTPRPPQGTSAWPRFTSAPVRASRQRQARRQAFRTTPRNAWFRPRSRAPARCSPSGRRCGPSSWPRSRGPPRRDELRVARRLTAVPFHCWPEPSRNSQPGWF